MTTSRLNLEHVKAFVLETASLEGQNGLWALLSASNARFGAAGAANVGALIECAIDELVDEGKLSLFRLHWEEGSSDATWTVLNRAEVRNHLASTWWKELPIQPPADIWVIPTEDLERRLRPGPHGRLPG